MSEERSLRIGTEVDTTGAREGFAEVRREAGAMAAAVTRSGQDATRAVAGIGSGADSSARQVESAQRNLIGSIQRTTAAMQAGSRSSSAYFEELARQRGVDPTILEPFLAQLREVEAAQTRANAAVGRAAPALASVGVSAAQTAAALRGVPAQFTDIVTSIQGGQAPLTVLLQQGGQLRDTFGSAGSAARGLGGYVLGLVNPFTIAAAGAVALAVGYHQGSQEADAYNKALILTGNVAGTSAGQLADMARSISKTTGTQAAAAEALAALAGTGKVAASDLQAFGEVALRGQRDLGQSVKDTVAQFSDLGKSPVAALERLNEQYHFLTPSIYAQVKALQDQGKADDAASLAQRTYSEAFGQRAQEVRDKMGALEKAWHTGAEAAKGWWDAVLDVGRPKTKVGDFEDISTEIQQRQARLARLQALGPGKDNQLAVSGEARKIAALQAQQSYLQEDIRIQNRASAAAAENNAIREAGVKWLKDGEQYMSRAAQLERDITAARNEGGAAQVSSIEIEKRVGEIRKKYADIYNDSIDSQIEALKRRSAVEDIVNKRSLDQMVVNKAVGLTSEQQYLEQVGALEVRAFDQKRAALEAELSLIAKKQNSEKDQKAKSGEIAALEAERTSRQIQLTNDLYVLETKRADAVNDKVLQSVLARGAMVDALKLEYQYYGRTSDARDAASVALKAEAELQDYIFNQKRIGAPLADDEIERLTREKDARVALTNATAGQSKALAYAQQFADQNKRFAIDYIADESQRAAAVLRIDDAMWQERIKLAGDGTEAQKLLASEYSTWYQNQLIKPQLDEWKKAVDTYSDVFRTGFAAMLNNGKSGWKSFTQSLVTTFKTSVADQIYKMFAQRFTVQVVASVTGQSGAAGVLNSFTSSGGSGSGSLDAASLISMGKSIYSGFAGGLTSSLGTATSMFGSAVGSSTISGFGAGVSASTSSAGQAMYASAASSGNLAAGTSAGMSAGTYAIPIAGWIAAGMALSNGLRKSGWDATNGSMKDPLKLGGGIMAFDSILRGIGLSDSAANVFSGQATIARLLGRKAPKVEDSGIEGTVGADGFNGNSYQKILEKGGIFRSDKRYTNTEALDASTEAYFDGTIKNLMSSVKSFGEVLGLPVTQIDGYTKAIKLTLTDDAAKNKEAVTQLFSGIGDDLSRLLAPSISEFSKAAEEFGGVGETASATLQRIVTEYTTLDAALESINGTFGAVGLESVRARERLLDLTGGLEGFAKGASFFAQNYLSETERLAPVAKFVDATLTELGFVGDKALNTRDDFKAAVQGLFDGGKLATEAGANTYAGLMKVQEGFAQLHPSLSATTEAIRNQRQDLQDQLDELTMSPDQLRAKQRAKVDPENVGLFDQVQTATSAKTAADALSAANKSYQDQIDSLLKSQLTGAELREAETKGMDASTVALYDRLAALKQEIESSKVAADAVIASAKARASVFQSIGDAFAATMTTATAAAASLRSFNDSLLLSNLSPLDPEQRYREAKRQFTESDGSDTSVVSAFLQASKDRDVDASYYQRDFAAAQSKLSAAAVVKDEIAASIPAAWKAMQEMLMKTYEPTPVVSAPVAQTVLGPVQTYYGSGTATSLDAGTLESAIDRFGDKLDAALAPVVTSTAKTADLLDSVTAGGNEMAVKA